MTMAVFWDVAPFSPVEIDRRFRGAMGLLLMPDIILLNG
jgi:hypothetical protein